MTGLNRLVANKHLEGEARFGLFETKRDHPGDKDILDKVEYLCRLTRIVLSDVHRDGKKLKLSSEKPVDPPAIPANEADACREILPRVAHVAPEVRSRPVFVFKRANPRLESDI